MAERSLGDGPQTARPGAPDDRSSGRLTEPERTAWAERGFFIRRGFAREPTMQTMLERVVEICRRHAAGESVAPALVLPETRANPRAANPEDLVSKVFRLHRDPVFEAFARDPRVLDAIADLVGEDVDVFLSQFIFKSPSAYGQPWHQDAFYFPFEPDRQVGVWLAVTRATLDNGCLHVLPGSHREPVHAHAPDRNPASNYGYLEIVDHDMSASVPALMEPGDLLVFHSHLMHRSTDNQSDGMRAAMVYHYSPAGTVDRAPRGPAYVNDWMPVRRRGTADAAAPTE